jgi:hypothetical protein
VNTDGLANEHTLSEGFILALYRQRASSDDHMSKSHRDSPHPLHLKHTVLYFEDEGLHHRNSNWLTSSSTGQIFGLGAVSLDRHPSRDGE